MRDILLAEDNAEYRQLMAIHLRRAGYRVTEAFDGVEALAALSRALPQLVILDIMMPRLNGLDATREIRAASPGVPILIVTARESFGDMREGFRRGADDYMTKPINMEEMLLRVAALIRRGGAETSGLSVGPYRLSGDTLSLDWKDGSLELRLKEFKLLEKLASYPGKIFTRRELMDDVWGYDSESDPRTVDTHIKRLREKLAELDDIAILTVRGLGYRLAVKSP